MPIRLKFKKHSIYSMLLACIAVTLIVSVTHTLYAQDEPSLSNQLGNDPNTIDRLLFIDSKEAWEAGELNRLEIIEHPDTACSALTIEKGVRGYPARGRFVSEVIETDIPFTELLPSWNADIDDETGLTVQIRVRDSENDFWSPWLYLGQWGKSLHWPNRTLRFETGSVHVDHIRLELPADAFQYRITMYSYDMSGEKRPVLRRLAAAYSGVIEDADQRAGLREASTLDGVWQKSLPVPFYTQQDLDPSVSGSTCSPTSVSMVVGYRSEEEQNVLENALKIYDPEYGIFGNWNRATAFAGDEGYVSWVQRMRNWDQVKSLIVEGQPVIASIRFREGEFPSNPMKSTRGHLIVIRGFDDEGNVIVNDPAHKEVGDAIVYNAEELGRAWFDKGGVAYIIGPEDKCAPR